MAINAKLSRRVGKALSSEVFRELRPSEISAIVKAVEKASSFSDLDAIIQRLIRKSEVATND